MNFSLPENTPNGQMNAVNANDKKITVSAGAGTGKTWVLTNRYLRLLLENENISPSDILTLTFTEAAAGEMKQRIENKINEVLKNFDDESRKRKILDGLSDSWISTIHSFAIRIIHESGLSLDIDPRAAVIPPQQSEDFWEGIKNALEFANLRELARTYGDKTLRDTAKILDEDKYLSAAVNKWKSYTLANLAESVAELHSSLGHSWQDMLNWSENQEYLIEKTWPEIENILRSEWLDVWNIWSKITLPPAPESKQAGVMLNSQLEWQSQNSPSNENLRKFYYSIVLDSAIKGDSSKFFKEVTNALGITFGTWRGSRPEILKTITLKSFEDISPEEILMRKTLMKFCALSWGMWDMMKQRRGLLSFSDMIIHSKKAIQNNSVNKTFAHILVDEFQDTDPLQFQMIESLIMPENDSHLFAVGDVKQSIYRFRHAEPSLFAKIMNDENTRNISLDVSFRTRYSLLNQINKIFSSMWHDGLGTSELMRKVSYESLITPSFDSEFSERDSGTMPDFKIILAKKAEKSSTDDVRKILADNIAFNISQWVNEGRTIWDKNQKIIRPVKFSDFAILSRSRSIYPVLEESFEKFGIKSIRDKSTEYFTRGEVNDIVCTLRAAANFHDDFSVTGWFLSPFSGISDADKISEFLNLIDEAHRPIDILRENFPEIYLKLEYFAVVGEVKGALGILDILDKDRKWLSCYKPDDRLRVLRNLRTAISLAGAFQNSGTSTLNACAEYLARSIRNKISYDEPDWRDENENAVKLCVVHAAKGLEYPVAIVFEARVMKNSDKRSVKPSKSLGLVFNDLPDEVKTDSEIKLSDWEKLLSEQGDLEEEARLFYVAATRAQDSLIFCGLLNKDDKPIADTWTEFLLNNVDNNNIEYAEAITPASDFSSTPSLDNEKKESLHLIRSENYLRQFSASSFALFELCPFAWRRRYRQGFEFSWENSEMNLDYETDPENFVGGSELGSLAHWVLSKWPKNENYESELEYYLNDREILSELPGNLRKIWRDKASKIALKEWLLNFAKSDLGEKLIREKNKIKREYRFRTKLENISLAGAMDAFYDDTVIDYKITSIEKSPSILYKAQMDFYAFAAHKITGCDSVKIVTVYLRDDKIVERVCSDFDEIRTRILNASKICASGFCEAKTENCVSCPFRKGCAKYE